MGPVHRFGSAFVFATALAVGMMASTASLEAADKKPSSKVAICKYLDSVINYPNVSPYILSWAIALYNYYDCDQVL